MPRVNACALGFAAKQLEATLLWYRGFGFPLVTEAIELVSPA